MKYYFIFFLVALFLNSCSFKKIGTDLGDGLGDSLKIDADSIGLNAGHGLTSSLTDSVSHKRLQNLADSIAAAFGSRLVEKASEASDSLFKNKIWNWADSLIEALTGQKIQLNIREIQTAFFGKTKTDIASIKKMILDMIDSITSNNTKDKLDALVDEVIGDKTNFKLRRLADSLVSHLVDTAFAKINRDYNAGIGKSVQKDADLIRDNAGKLLLILAAIAAIIIFLVWWSRRKYLHLINILTKNIDGITDQKIYSNVTGNIKSDAMTAGLESELRDLLDKNGLLHSKKRRA